MVYPDLDAVQTRSARVYLDSVMILVDVVVRVRVFVPVMIRLLDEDHVVRSRRVCLSPNQPWPQAM